MIALRQRIHTWTSSFWLTRREFFRALRPGRVLYLGERGLLVKGRGHAASPRQQVAPQQQEERGMELELYRKLSLIISLFLVWSSAVLGVYS